MAGSDRTTVPSPGAVAMKLWRKPSSRAFAFPLRGDCLYPAFEDGDIVAIDPAVQPKDGDFVAVETAKGLLLKRFKLTPSGIFLDVTNRSYEPYGLVKPSDKIVGVAIGRSGVN